MSQKHAVAIFVASFVAGLLATVLLVEPQESAPLQNPFFGFAEEQADAAATPQPPVAFAASQRATETQTVTDTAASTAADTPHLPTVLADSPNRPWSQPPADPTAVVAATPAPQADLPRPMALSQEEIGSLEELVRRVDQKPADQKPAAQKPADQRLADGGQIAAGQVAVTAFSKEQPSDGTTTGAAKVPAPSARTGTLAGEDTATSQPRTTPEALAAIDNSTHAADVAVKPAKGQPAPAMAHVHQTATPATAPSDSSAVKNAPPEPFDTSDAEAFAALGTVTPEPATPTEATTTPLPTTPAQKPEPPSPEPTRTATQGHVGKAIVVESPDSLRALVSRTQPENQTPENQKSENQPAEATEAATTPPDASVATADAAKRPAADEAQAAAARSQATTRGLESAAAALERAEQTEQNIPVKSLLTRTLGPSKALAAPTPSSASATSPAPAQSPTRQAPPQITARPASIASPEKPRQSERTGLLDLSREQASTTEADTPPYPKHWDNQPAVSLTPRHPRPRTATAPAPPLRTDLIGSSVQPKSAGVGSVSTDSAVGTSWVDPDRDNWTRAVTTPPVKPAPPVESPRERIVKRLSQNTGRSPQADAPPAPVPPPDAANSSQQVTPPPETPVKRLLDRIRPNERLRDRFGQLNDQADRDDAAAGGQPAWPPPTELLRQLKNLAAEASPRPSVCRDIQKWTNEVAGTLERVQESGTLTADSADTALNELANCAGDGMLVAGAITDDDLASQVRRVAFAVKRRAATWQAARALAVESRSQLAANAPDLVSAELVHLLTAIETFETEATAPQAALIRQAMATATATRRPGNEDLLQAIGNQYAAPNVRLSLRDEFLSRLMPETTSRTDSLNDVVLGRPVRGRRVVEQTTSIELTPDEDEICFDLVVDGQLSTYGITDAGPISMASRGAGQFTVRKPIKVCRQGLLVGPSKASATNRARLMNVSTSFDSVPLMGSMLRALAKNQHAENLPEANREVAQKIVWQSCRECDQESEEKFAALSARIEEKVWNPLVRLGLQPTPYMQTTADMATLRLRLHADTQLAAHTPRPREPAGTLLGLQVHQSALNNAFDRLGIGGQELALEALFTRVQERLGLEPKLPEDLPEGVTVTFEAVEPIRVEFADGLVNVKVAIDALESGRRDWYDVIGQVNYKPVAIGNRVLLERDGPIRIGGPGHRGRIEFALRTIFGKIFPKERPLVLLPEKLTDHPGLQDLAAVQAVSWDGWLALALAERPPLKTATQTKTPPQR